MAAHPGLPEAPIRAPHVEEPIVNAVGLVLRSAAAAGLTAVIASAALAQSNTSGPDALLEADRMEVVNLGSSNRSPEVLKKGLFPEDSESPEQRAERERCERLLSSGFKCMPPARVYSKFILGFAFGSAELPDALKVQLKSFADALRGRSSSSPAIRIDGHADGRGTPEANQILSESRARAVRDFLVAEGRVNPALLEIKGHGASELLNPSDAAAAENRRVEIGRNLRR